MNRRSSLAAVGVCAFLVACAGNSATLVPARDNLSQSQGSATLRVRITVPKPRPHAIDPHYMSKATKGVAFAFKGASTYDATFAVTPGSKGCSTNNGVTKCTFNLQLRTGKYKGTVSAYDSVPVKGAIPKNANLLSTEANVPFTIVSGKVNRAGFVFGGVVKSLSVNALPGGTIGTPLSTPISVQALDADGNTIVGTYANPITLSDSDTSGATTVATSGNGHPAVGQLLSSRDTATLNYSGAGLVSATVFASATGIAAARATFAPAPAITNTVLANAGGTTVGDLLIGAETLVTITGHFAAGATTVAVSGNGVTIGDVSATATTITATLFTDPEASTGPRSLTASTTAATSAQESVTISNTGIDVVTLDTDSNPGSPPGTGAGASGDLRYAILNAHVGDTIVFDTAAMCGAAQCTIALSGPLPPIAQNLTIDGGEFTGGTPRVITDGASTWRAFWAQSGTVTIANLQIQHAKAQGGNGGYGGYLVGGGGGGGAGLGAGIFIDTAAVKVVNDYFLNDGASGGNGLGRTNGGADNGGGGGGLGGNGGDGTSSGGGGGGGITGAGAASNTSGGGNGGDGFTATGGNGGARRYTGSGGSGGSGTYGGGGGGGGECIGGACPGGLGGAGGFGAGAGGPATGEYSINGAAGGFGGGGSGGSGAGGGAGGAGGPGGGGGGGASGTGGSGGTLATISGGSGDAFSEGGGGAAAGPAIFVTTGSLTTLNSGASGASATGGAAGGASAGAGGADSTPVFNYGGTVNGSTTAGPVANALGSTAPQLRHRESRRKRKGFVK